MFLIGERNYVSSKSDLEHQRPKGKDPDTLIETLVFQVAKLSDRIDQLLAENKEQTLQNQDLIDTIKDLTDIIKDLKKDNAAKDARIAELEEKNNKDCSNSSKPSGSDFFNKPRRSSINKGSKGGAKKSSGGQKGHFGSTMKLKATDDVIHHCLPSDCIGCPQSLKCENKVAESRHVVDVRIVKEQSRYDRIERLCPKTGLMLSGQFPEIVSAPQQYGNHLKALVVALSSFGMISTSRISEILAGVADLSISDGTVCNILTDCAQRSRSFIAELKERVLASDIVHFDETGMRVKGKVHWGHTASTKEVTLIHSHEKRGIEGILAGGVLKGFRGIASHDCWGPYYRQEFSDVIHAVCGAHIDRELEGVIQNKKQRWARSLQILLKGMLDAKQKMMEQDLSSASAELVNEYSRTYDRILERGFSRNPYRKPKVRKRGKPKKGKVLSLLERLRNLKDDVMRFFTDFRVPFSNNVAERSFRMSKLKMKVAGTFRSTEGGANFCTIFSIIDTVRKNGRNPFAALVRLFDNSFSLDFLS
jgi:transposase-like protein